MFQLILKLDHQNAQRAEAVLGDLALAVTWFEEPGQKLVNVEDLAPNWQLDAIFAQKPDLKSLKKILRAAQVQPKRIILKKLPPVDWLKQNQESFAPIRAGRFYVHPTDAPRTPPAVLPILIDAATAFGTGQHATTYGCLVALDRIARIKHHAQSVCDMGCGTAILAMAAARIWPMARLIAADIDPEAVRVSKRNVAVNGLRPRLRPIVGSAFTQRALRSAPKHDVIFANILAKPLRRLALGMQAQLAPGGCIILSGLLTHQENMVLSAYARFGLRLVSRIRVDGWSTLVVSR